MSAEAVSEGPFATTPQALRGQAEGLDAEAEALREQARELRAQATSMRRRAAALEQEQLLAAELRSREGPLADLGPHRQLGEKILQYLTAVDGKPVSSTQIQEHVGAGSLASVRTTLEKLRDADAVVRTGIKRGARYFLAGREPKDAPSGDSARLQEYVRDRARELGTFAFADIQAACPHTSDGTLRRWLARWTEEGTLEVERIGKAYLYAYVKPDEPSPTHAPRGEPKIESIVRRASTTAGSQGKVAGRSAVRDLVKLAQDQGATIREAKHGYLVTRDGKPITSVPKTASDHRSLANTRADLRRGGFTV